MSQRSMMLAFGIVIGIQILGIALPIRFLGGLAQQSPIANQVGRLDVLLLRGAYMSRDLIIKDKLSALFMVRCRLALMQLVETGVVRMIMLTYDAAWVQFTVGSGTKQQKLHGHSQCALFSRCHFTAFGSRSRPLSVAPIWWVVGNRIWQAGQLWDTLFLGKIRLSHIESTIFRLQVQWLSESDARGAHARVGDAFAVHSL